jgi:hypothetical protein
MSYAKIKKYAIFLLLMIAIFLCFGYMTLRLIFWKIEAMRNAHLAATLLAEKHYDKGINIKLELVVKDNFASSQNKSYHFDGPNVVFDKIGYTDPVCKFIKSPSILVSEEFVRVYNEKMNEIISDPNFYKLLNREDANYWQQIFLSKPPSELKNDSNN